MINRLKELKAEAILFVMTIIWGGTFILTKNALNDISSMLYVGIRFSIAASVLLPLVIHFEKKIDKKALWHGIILGFFLYLGFFGQTYGLRFTSATKSGFLTGTLVVFIPIFAIFIKKRYPSVGAIIGTIIVFIGIIFLSTGGNSITTFFEEVGRDFNFGDQLTLAAAIVFALHVVLIDIYSSIHKFWSLFFIQLTTTAILSLITSFVLDATNIELLYININFDVVTALLYTALLATLFNIGMQIKYQKEVTPTKAGIIYSFEPVFAGLFASFLLNEKISNFGLIGSVLIFTGLITTEVYDSIRKSKRERSNQS
ncbi:MAG: DMT family transporter [Melioribacteraceae bacterium]|nr:DMT family transporter [Melioribacteraceae bacterium]